MSTLNKLANLIKVVTELIVAANNLCYHIEQMQQQKTKDPSRDLVVMTDRVARLKRKAATAQNELNYLTKRGN